MKMNQLTVEDKAKFYAMYNALIHNDIIKSGVVSFEEAYRYNFDILKFVWYRIKMESHDKYNTRMIYDYIEALASVAASGNSLDCYKKVVEEGKL